MYSNRLRIVIQRLLEKDVSRRISATELLNLIPNLVEEEEEPPISLLPSVREPMSPKRVTFDKLENPRVSNLEALAGSNKVSDIGTPKPILKKPSE